MAKATYDQISVSKMVCEKFLVYATSVMDDYPGLAHNMEMRVNQTHDHINRCVIFLKSWMLDGHKVVRKEDRMVRFPSSPWQFFKQRYFPEWALERWPVQETAETFTVAEHHHYICPHMVVDERDKHIMFMYEGVNSE